ncbi:DUF1294 domain-containing protein [Chryseobacterium daeguense]|uniref:DUF1294 domain-containing protein n=1 Tax=Chryseobacterium daeguense TaxID=412438 RepID=UPI0005529082|nr:DUF1294 domain-containing protein [Chryseobacterium daeguense]
MTYLLIIINLVCFIVFGFDKKRAVKHQKRISEKTLLAVTFLGGTIGAVFGMIIFRHKISKASFLIKFGVIVLIQIIIFYFFEEYSSYL